MNSTTIRLTLCLTLAALLMSSSSAMAAQLDTTGTLRVDQQEQLLEEATQQYDLGMSTAATDVATAREAFTSAATKYQSLIDSGVRNAKLFVNLGNAYKHSGNTALAIVAFEKAAVLRPSDTTIDRRIQECRVQLEGAAETAPSPGGFMAQAAAWNHSLPRIGRLGVASLAWATFWVAGTIVLLRRQSGWKQTLLPSLAALLLAGSSLAWDYAQTRTEPRGIVTAEATLRSANGETFAAVLAQPLKPGTEFTLTDTRNGWLSIRLPDGKTGWITAASSELISARTFL